MWRANLRMLLIYNIKKEDIRAVCVGGIIHLIPI